MRAGDASAIRAGTARGSVPAKQPAAPQDMGQTARIYVIGSPRHLEEAAEGTRTWWCIERSSTAGELAAVYVKGQGFRFLFRVVQPGVSQQRLCADHGLGTGEVEILRKRSTPISAQALREHRLLRTLPALKRSFQRKSFRLEPPHLDALVTLIAAE